MTHPANEGLCYITAVEPAFAPAACIVRTSLAEKFPVFAANIAMVAENCLDKHIPVSLTIMRSERGTDFVSAIQPIDFFQPSQPCAKCGRQAVKVTRNLSTEFHCESCHHIMFLTVPPYQKYQVSK